MDQIQIDLSSLVLEFQNKFISLHIKVYNDVRRQTWNKFVLKLSVSEDNCVTGITQELYSCCCNRTFTVNL